MALLVFERSDLLETWGASHVWLNVAGDDSDERAAKATGVKKLRCHGVEESGGSESEHQGVQTSSSSSHSQARPTPSQVHSWKLGDWQCKECGNWNYVSRMHCNFSACPAAVWKRGDWECTACGNHNYASREFCAMRKCGAPRP